MRNRILVLLVAACMLCMLIIQGCVAKVDGPGGEGGDNPSIQKPQDNETHEPDNQSGKDKNEDDLDPKETDEGQENKGPNLVRYISASRLNVRKEPSVESDKVGQLMQGTAVNVLEEATSEDAKGWLKISYNNGVEDITGWITSEYTVENRADLLSDKLKSLDYSPQEKVDEYPENPRVKVRGIYVTIHSAGGSRLDKLIELANNSDINTFVIDVKDDKGHMLFKNEAAEKHNPEANNYATVKDINALMKKLKDNNIYAIARIVCFKDPVYVKNHMNSAIVYRDSGKPYSDKDGMPWVTAYDRNLWQYNIDVAKEAAKVGFNEIQFDYVRFPASSGGKLDAKVDYRNANNETKPEAIQNFLKEAYKEISALKVYISADVYGLVGSVTDDMDLGQYWEAISNVVDYICPMMYPSHYADNTYNLPVPDAYPYETVLNSARDSVMRNRNIETPAIVRPWIQDFTASWVPGYIPYGENEVRAQIKALKENGVDEYMLWNPNNRYTEAAVKN